MKKYDKDNRPAGLHTSLPSDSFDPEKYLKDITNLRKQLGLVDLPVPSAPHLTNADPHFDHTLSQPPGGRPEPKPKPKKEAPTSEFGEIYDAEDTGVEELRNKLGISLPDASLRAIQNQLHRDANKDADEQLAQYEREQAEVPESEEAFVDSLIDSVKEETPQPEPPAEDRAEQETTTQEASEVQPQEEQALSISVDEEDAEELPPLKTDEKGKEILDFAAPENSTAAEELPASPPQQELRETPSVEKASVTRDSEPTQPEKSPQETPVAPEPEAPPTPITSEEKTSTHDLDFTEAPVAPTPTPEEQIAKEPVQREEPPVEKKQEPPTTPPETNIPPQEVEAPPAVLLQEKPEATETQAVHEKASENSVVDAFTAPPEEKQLEVATDFAKAPEESSANLDLEEPISREEEGKDEWIEDDMVSKVLEGTGAAPPSPEQVQPEGALPKEELTPEELKEETKKSDVEAYVDEHMERINKDLRRLHSGEDLYQEKLMHLKEGILRCRELLKKGHVKQAKRYYNVLSKLFNSLARNDPQRQKWFGVITKLYDDIAEQS